MHEFSCVVAALAVSLAMASMITQYAFHRETGKLLYAVKLGGNVERLNVRNMRADDLCTVVVVKEGEHARREMFAHFGDDSSWPFDWWERLQ